MKKVIFIIAMMVAFVMSMTSMAFAADLDTPVDPLNPEPYQNAISASAGCKVSASGIATCTVTVAGKSGVTKIEANYTLQKKSGKSWSNVASWSKTANGTSLNDSKTKAVSKGYTYRTKASIKVYKNGTAESITVYSPNVAY